LLPTPIASDAGGQELTYKGSHKDGAAQVGAASLTLLGATSELPTPTGWDAAHPQDENFGRPTLLGALKTAEDGSLLPTPTTGDSSVRGLRPGSGLTLDQAVGARPADPAMPEERLIPTITAQDADDQRNTRYGAGGNLTPLGALTGKMTRVERLRLSVTGSALLPTPTAEDGSRGSDAAGRAGSPSLGGALLPTPTRGDGESGPGSRASDGYRPGLEEVAQLLPTPIVADGRHYRETVRADTSGPSLFGAALAAEDIKMLPTPTAHDQGNTSPKDAPGRQGGASLSALAGEGRLLPTPIAYDATGKEFPYGTGLALPGAVKNLDGGRPDLVDDWQEDATKVIEEVVAATTFEQEHLPGLDRELLATNVRVVDEAVTHRLGVYGPAADRWALVVGREAPDPTYVDSKDDRRKLSPLFGEWMMGLPAGWVTDVLEPRKALRAIGNGVVPQQAAEAVWLLLRSLR
jgi:hypothetical protein